MDRRAFDLNESEDEFIKAVAGFARYHLIPAYVTGLSALTRISGSPPPLVEFIAFNTLAEMNLFCEQGCLNERVDFASDDTTGLTSVSFGGKATLVCVKSRLHQFVGSRIELVTIDVRNGVADDDDMIFELIDKKVCGWLDKPSHDPTNYWRVFLTTGYLKGFTMPNIFCSAEFLCGNVERSPLFRFPKVNAYELNQCTYGGRVITHAVCESIGAVNFQMDALLAMHDQFLGIEQFEGFEDRYFENIPQMYENLKINVETLRLDDLRTVRMALLMMPMYLYAQEKEQTALNFLKNTTVPQDFDDFVKMSGVHQTEYNRCPFIVWFFVSRHCFPSSLIFEAIAVCSAWFQLRGRLSPPEWVFVEAPFVWREAIALASPSDCDRYLNAINQSGVLAILRDPLVEISNNELQKAFGVRGRTMSVGEMKLCQMQFLMTHSHASMTDFRNWIQRDSRFQHGRQRW